MSKRAVLFLTTGFEEAEAVVPIDVLRRGGVEVVIVSLTGEKRVVGSHDIKLETDALFGDIRNEMYDAVILPGGPGANRYYENKTLLEYIQKHAAENRLTAAICAAPGVLGHLGMLNGKRATCYRGYEERLAGADFTGNNAETDGNIITGRSAGWAYDFAFAILEYLCGSDMRGQIADAMIYYR